jgi:hypothetical protein
VAGSVSYTGPQTGTNQQLVPQHHHLDQLRHRPDQPTRFDYGPAGGGPGL